MFMIPDRTTTGDIRFKALALDTKSAALAQTAVLVMITGLTVRPVVERVELAAFKITATGMASKAVSVPLSRYSFVARSNGSSNNNVATAPTQLDSFTRLAVDTVTTVGHR
jgi:hypothetical protein